MENDPFDAALLAALEESRARFQLEQDRAELQMWREAEEQAEREALAASVAVRAGRLEGGDGGDFADGDAALQAALLDSLSGRGVQTDDAFDAEAAEAIRVSLLLDGALSLKHLYTKMLDCPISVIFT